MIRIAIHGGVGSTSDESQQGVDRAGSAASAVNEKGGTAQDIAIAAVVSMEDDDLFNAGTGSSMRWDGSCQMDASVMTPGRFGGVACIEWVKNPVLVAMDVMETPHILLAADGAVKFARSRGHGYHDPRTEKNMKKWIETKDRVRKGQLRESEARNAEFWKVYAKEHGDTVGAVAFKDGVAAAALSTGGTSLMMPGRVGDTPLLGAGIYSGEHGAVVCTGVGEEIIRRVTAFRCHELVPKLGPQAACDSLVNEFPKDFSIGIICAGPHGIGVAASHPMARHTREL
ncbi:MAG TPA: isoaspartyl peptidase/L-asparaginase [Thermoplasmata archaeon]|nr:isoaspartyl peptidase/L-asparaginase [Thermoplasmata archaeon]